VQYAAEAHIMTTVAKGEASDWGCNDFWDVGALAVSNCIAVFGILYQLNSPSPPYFTKVFNEANATAGSRAPFSEQAFDVEELLPEGDRC
jgi:hypothetical protein